MCMICSFVWFASPPKYEKEKLVEISWTTCCQTVSRHTLITSLIEWVNESRNVRKRDWHGDFYILRNDTTCTRVVSSRPLQRCKMYPTVPYPVTFICFRCSSPLITETKTQHILWIFDNSNMKKQDKEVAWDTERDEVDLHHRISVFYLIFCLRVWA